MTRYSAERALTRRWSARVKNKVPTVQTSTNAQSAVVIYPGVTPVTSEHAGPQAGGAFLQGSLKQAQGEKEAARTEDQRRQLKKPTLHWTAARTDAGIARWLGPAPLRDVTASCSGPT